MHANVPTILCAGCAARVPDTDGPTHAYIGASPGCWAIYCDVLAREYGEYRNPPWHRVTVDAYASQHPGVESRRSVQSVGGHLIALYLLIERKLDPVFITKRMPAIVSHASEFSWLDPPGFDGTPNVLRVAETSGIEQHERAVFEWAAGVWEAWSPHHKRVREWAKPIADPVS